MEKSTKALLIIGFIVLTVVGVIYLKGIYNKSGIEDKMELGALNLDSITKPVEQDRQSSFTSSSEYYCNEIACYRKIYSGTMFIQDDDGLWKTVSELTNMKWENNLFNISYKNTWVTLEPFIIYNGKYRTIQDIKNAFPNVNLKDKIEFSRFDHKFALNFSNVPQNLVNNIDYIGFRLVETRGITWDDVERDRMNIKIKDKIQINFQDLINSNYNITFVNKTYLLIGNISANYRDGGIYLDPLIQLVQADTENLGDSYTHQESNQTNFGTSNVMLSSNTTTSTKNSIIKFNISGINTSYSDASLNLYLAANTLDVDSEGYNISAHRIYQFPTYNISNIEWNETAINWNNAPNRTTHYNATPTQDLKFFGGLGEPLQWQRWNINTSLNQEIAGGGQNLSVFLQTHSVFGSPSTVDDLQFSTKEQSTLGQRPYLLLTYGSVNENCNNGVCVMTFDNVLNDLEIRNTTLSAGNEGYQVMFNISEFCNESGTPTNAVVQLYINRLVNTSALDDDYNISLLNWNNWTENTTNLYAQTVINVTPTVNSTSGIMTSTIENTIVNFTVTAQLDYACDRGFTNASFRILDPDYHITSISASSDFITNEFGNDEVNSPNYYSFAAREDGNITKMPKLIISYSAGADTTAPQFSNILVNDTSPEILDAVLFSTLWSDNTALANYTFSWNATGVSCDTWANDSTVSFTGILNWSNITKSIPSTCLLGNVPSIAWRVWANDSVGNLNVTPITFSFFTPSTNCYTYNAGTKTTYIPNGCTYYKGSDYI